MRIRATVVAVSMAGLAVGLTSACGSRDDASGTSGAGAKPAAGIENKDSTKSEDGAVTDDLRFPGTTVTVELTGYDRGLQMVNFELVELAPGTGNMEPHYVDVPGDGTHRLPLADNLKVWSANMICSSGSETGVTVDAEGRGDQPCTEDQLLEALDRSSGLTAELKVDAQDRIYEVAELYHP
jgi:hypothetical protein